MKNVTQKILLSAIATSSMFAPPALAQNLNGTWQCAQRTSRGNYETASIQVQGNRFSAQVSHNYLGNYQATGNVHFDPATSQLFFHGGNTSIPGPIVNFLVDLQNDRQGYRSSCQGDVCIETRCQR